MTEENGTVVDMTVRLYGPNTEYVINRERELQVTIHRYMSSLSGIFSRSNHIVLPADQSL